MDPVETKLNILIDGMKKKSQALTEIKSITENQGTVLASALKKDEILAFIVQMNREKQVNIQTVIDCDNLFEKILKEIGPELDANQHLYGPQINAIQEMIRVVMDLDVSIRVLEDKNNDKMKRLNGLATPRAQRSVIPEHIKEMKKPNVRQAAVIKDDNRVIKAYENNSRNYKG